jgi:hypothetical protein
LRRSDRTGDIDLKDHIDCTLWDVAWGDTGGHICNSIREKLKMNEKVLVTDSRKGKRLRKRERDDVDRLSGNINLHDYQKALFATI